VRAGAPWCSLCYLDLRATSRLVSVPAARQSGEGRVSAPLVEAALEPGPANWSTLADAEVVDAEFVDAEFVESPQGPAPATGPSDADVRWPCGCGAEVTLNQPTCPACGSEFLGALRNEGGRHRRGADGPRIRSRAARLSLAGLLALVLAVAIPVLLALVG
jgi:hypothetical protein